MTGPGWSSDREYRAGDRVLLHARYGAAASRLVNGTTATVTHVDGDGLTVTPRQRRRSGVPAAAFVQGTRKDGSPNLSHAWARTVDGAQGGTWETCHLLGSAALDAYRGYTGQSRSRQPTHTWNTTRVAVVDHGGVLADQRDAAEQVADALARQPDPSLAARSDPWTVDRSSANGSPSTKGCWPAGRPTAARRWRPRSPNCDRAQAWLANMDAIAEHTGRQLDDLGRLAGLTGGVATSAAAWRTSWPATPEARRRPDSYDEVARRVAQLGATRTRSSGSRRPRAGGGTTSAVSATSLTTTGPGRHRLCPGRRSPRVRDRQAPPRPHHHPRRPRPARCHDPRRPDHEWDHTRRQLPDVLGPATRRASPRRAPGRARRGREAAVGPPRPPAIAAARDALPSPSTHRSRRPRPNRAA